MLELQTRKIEFETRPPVRPWVGEPPDLLADFGAWLRLHVADGDASEHTIRSYHAHAKQYAKWCADQDIRPGLATEADLLRYRRHLVGRYARGTVGVKLAAVRRLYEAALWRGLRGDNPAAGLKAPRDKTQRSERIKYLPLDGLRRLLSAPEGDPVRTPSAALAAGRDRAILALMGVHGLRVAEVAGLDLGDVDLEQGTVRVLGKGGKWRTIILIASTARKLRVWLDIRLADASCPDQDASCPDQDASCPDQDASWAGQALFVALDRRTNGTRLTTGGLRYIVDGYLEALGLKAQGISCHSLRHSAATWSRAGGAKIDAIADMLGHASTDTTRPYAQIVDRMRENPAKFLETIL